MRLARDRHADRTGGVMKCASRTRAAGAIRLAPTTSCEPRQRASRSALTATWLPRMPRPTRRTLYSSTRAVPGDQRRSPSARSRTSVKPPAAPVTVKSRSYRRSASAPGLGTGCASTSSPTAGLGPKSRATPPASVVARSGPTNSKRRSARVEGRARGAHRQRQFYCPEARPLTASSRARRPVECSPSGVNRGGGDARGARRLRSEKLVDPSARRSRCATAPSTRSSTTHSPARRAAR